MYLSPILLFTNIHPFTPNIIHSYHFYRIPFHCLQRPVSHHTTRDTRTRDTRTRDTRTRDTRTRDTRTRDTRTRDTAGPERQGPETQQDQDQRHSRTRTRQQHHRDPGAIAIDFQLAVPSGNHGDVMTYASNVFLSLLRLDKDTNNHTNTLLQSTMSPLDKNIWIQHIINYVRKMLQVVRKSLPKLPNSIRKKHLQDYSLSCTKTFLCLWSLSHNIIT